MGSETRWVARLARVAFALVLAIVASSAFLRLSAGTPDASQPAVEAARIAHRVSASLAGLLVLLVTGLVVTRDRSRRPDIVLAVATLAVMLALAWVGRYSGPDASSTVLLMNLAGGLALSTLLWALGARESRTANEATAGSSAPLALATLLVVALQCITGAMTVTGFAKVGLAHRACGAVALGLCTWLAVRLGHSPALRRTGRAILALAVLQAALGLAALAFSLPLWLVLAHNVGAALLLAALAQAAGQACASNPRILPNFR